MDDATVAHALKDNLKVKDCRQQTLEPNLPLRLLYNP